MISNGKSEVILAKKLGVALPNVAAKRWFQPAPMVPILRDIDLRAHKGQCLGIVGESGSGKTTLARAITGVWRPVGGKIRLDGASLD